MMEKLKKYFTQTSVIAYALGFVVLWFGISELINPAGWVAYAPAFLGEGQLAITLIFVHGLSLTIAGLLVIFNFYRRLGALVLALMFIQIIGGMLIGSGLSEVVVRDIGILGMALALAIKSDK